MARQNGKLILFSDIHAGMPEAELRRRQAQMDEALEEIAANPDNVVVLGGDTIEGPFVPVEIAPDAGWETKVTAFARSVRDRLGYFLEMIDQCDVHFLDRIGERLEFRVCASQEQNLDLIRDAIARERPLLNELGIEPRDVDLDRGMIRIRVPVPSSDGQPAYC